jgi:cytochrome b
MMPGWRAGCIVAAEVAVMGDPVSEERGLSLVRVWDLPTRLFHWTLVLCVVASFVSAQIGGNAMAWHMRSGYAVFALLAFRLVWGFVGGHWSRFSSFLYGPATLLRYLRKLGRADEHLDAGHSPLGSLSVFALLLFLAAQVGTGLFADDEIATTGPLNKFVSNATGLLLSGYHADVGQWILVALVALHVAAIVAYRLRLRKDLIGPMLRGDKLLPAGVPPSRDTHGTRALAVVLLTACAAVVACLVSLGG